MRLRARTVACLAVTAIGVGIASADVAPPPAPKIVLEGIIVQLASAGTWSIYRELPRMKNDERWMCGSIRIQSASDPAAAGAPMSEGTRELRQGEERCAATIESFAGAAAQKELREYLLTFENRSKQPVTLSLLDAASGRIDMRVVPVPKDDGPPVRPRAFLIPGLAVASTSFVKSFDGPLAAQLAPGEKTWALVVFEAASSSGLVQLHVKDQQLALQFGGAIISR